MKSLNIIALTLCLHFSTTHTTWTVGNTARTTYGTIALATGACILTTCIPEMFDANANKDLAKKTSLATLIILSGLPFIAKK